MRKSASNGPRGGRAAAGNEPRGWRRSGRLQGALGQDVGDCALLHADLHVVGDFHRDEVLTDVGDAAGDAAIGQHLVALGQTGQQGAVFLGAFHLRTDGHEVEHGEEQHHHDQQLRFCDVASGGSSSASSKVRRCLAFSALSKSGG